MPDKLRTSCQLFRPGLVLILTFLCHAAEHLPSNARADRVVVNKKEHILTLLDHGTVLKEY